MKIKQFKENAKADAAFNLSVVSTLLTVICVLLLFVNIQFLYGVLLFSAFSFFSVFVYSLTSSREKYVNYIVEFVKKELKACVTLEQAQTLFNEFEAVYIKDNRYKLGYRLDEIKVLHATLAERVHTLRLLNKETAK